MKKGKLVEGNKNRFVFVFLLLLLVALIIAGFFSGFFGKITTLATNPITLNITVGGPQIVAVYNTSSSLSLSSGPYSTSKSINFTVYDGASASLLNNNSATLNVTLLGTGAAGEATRTTSNCSLVEIGANYANYTCNITMWWFDGSGNWNITAFILDTSGNAAVNRSVTMAVSATTGFNIGPTNVTWSSFAPGATNQTSNNDPFNLTNIGNQPIGNSSGNISINSTNLLGETSSSYALYANNFTVSTITGGAGCVGATCTECGNASGINLNLGLYRNISTAVLPKGNYTIGDTTTAIEQLYYCIRTTGFDLPTQAYSTSGGGLWTVMIS